MKFKMQKKITIGLVLFSLIVFHGNQVVNASRAPDFLAYNKQTNECSLYWPGDEFVFYKLPAGWEMGSYIISENIKQEIKQECELKGYKYIENINGIHRITTDYGMQLTIQSLLPILVFLFLIILIIVGIVAIILKRKKLSRVKL
ncbi:MAG: hypothetical protein WCJ58_04410 [bacterium]